MTTTESVRVSIIMHFRVLPFPELLVSGNWYILTFFLKSTRNGLYIRTYIHTYILAIEDMIMYVHTYIHTCYRGHDCARKSIALTFFSRCLAIEHVTVRTLIEVWVPQRAHAKSMAGTCTDHWWIFLCSCICVCMCVLFACACSNVIWYMCIPICMYV